MGSDLRGLLHGGAEAKRLVFAAEDFAGDYGRAVISRVKRRRAVTATAMGGGTLIAAGAIVVGANTAPWSSIVAGATPGPSPSVVCTTSTPDAGTPQAQEVPKGATMVFLDNATGDVAFGAERGSGATVWYRGEVVGTVEDDTPIAMTFLSGETFRFTPTSTGGGGLFEGSGVSLLPIDDYLERAAAVPSGSPNVIADCLTVAPEPSESALPTASPAPSDTSVAWVWDPGKPGNTPFQCGFEFLASESHTAEFSVSAELVPIASVQAGMRGGAAVETPPDGLAWKVAWDMRPSTVATYDAGKLSVVDPADRNGDFPLSGDAGDGLLSVNEAVSFVAVVDGVVVATLVSDGLEAPAGAATTLPLSQLPTAYAWELSAFTPCAGFTGDLGDAGIYGVGGYSPTSDGGAGYAWERITD